MRNRELLSVSDFAKLSQTTRDTLIYYDNIGLLPPASRGGSGYRFYSSNQLAVINLISICRDLGMSLREIKKITDHRDPDRFNELFNFQLKQIDERVGELRSSRELLLHLRNMISSALEADWKTITFQELPAEPIVIGEQNDYSNGGNDYDALCDFYRYCREKYPELDTRYPVSGYFSEERIKKGDWGWPDRYCFSTPFGYDLRPAGLYIVGYSENIYGESDKLYERVMECAAKNGYEINGPAYEEYPLNAVSVSNTASLLTRLIISVHKK